MAAITKASRVAALKLPDQLLVRYFRAGEIDAIVGVVGGVEQTIVVHLTFPDSGKRFDHWRDLGGGLGYVPGSE